MGQDGPAGDVGAGRGGFNGGLQNRFTHDFRLFPSQERGMRLTPVLGAASEGHASDHRYPPDLLRPACRASPSLILVACP